MNQTTAATVFLDLPLRAGRGALRGGLTALGVAPRDLDPAALPRALAERPRSLAFVDVSPAPGQSRLLELNTLVPAGAVRSRVVLTRLTGGYVTPAERRWVRNLGFRDFLCGFDSQHAEGQVRHAVDIASEVLALTSPPPDRLARYIGTAPDDMFQRMPWRTIRQFTGMTPDELVDLLQQSLDVRERSYRMRIYEDCFLGTEATGYLEHRFRLQPSQAVELGDALVQLGLLVHVMQEHPFRDEALFYRLAASPAADRVDLGSAASCLTNGGLVVTDRQLPRPKLRRMLGRQRGCGPAVLPLGAAPA